MQDFKKDLATITEGEEQATAELQKLNKRFDLNQATVFSIDCQQEQIVLKQLIRELQSSAQFIGTERKDDDGKLNTMHTMAEYYTKQYFNRMSQHSQKTNQAISQRYEAEINVETFRRLHNFFYGYLPQATKDAIKLLGLNKW